MTNDMVTNQVIHHGLLAGAREMARNLCRSSYSTAVYELHEYANGIHDASGDVVAEDTGMAIFTRGNDYALRKAMEIIDIATMRAGDVFILNYPYWSSAHTLDPIVFAPIIVDQRLIGFATSRVHVVDLNQKDAGYVLDSTNIAQEGLILPATKLYDAGSAVADAFNIIRFNSRSPTRTIGDIRALASACFTGVQRTSDLAAKYGVDALTSAMTAINAHGEKLARLALARLPRGTWSASDFMDSDGVDLDRPIRMHVSVTVTEDEMIMDWSETDRDVRGPANLPIGQTEAFCSLVFKALTTPDSPVVAGNFRPLRVVTVPGSLMHAVPPMPTFTGQAVIYGSEVVLKALAQGMPDRVPACSGGDVGTLIALGINPRDQEEWFEAVNEAVGLGGHSGGDGADGQMQLSQPGCRNVPVEVLESKAPMLIESYGYLPDTGGAGFHRGGVGIGRTYRFLAPTTAISLSFKTQTKPWAIGGGEGGNNHIILNPGTDRAIKQGGSYNLLEAGEVLANNTGGGGGFGNPLARSQKSIVADVRNGFVTIAGAARDYGIELDPKTLNVLADETAALRHPRL